MVTLDILDATKSELQHEIFRLRTRVQILATLLRVLIVAMKLSEFSVEYWR